MERGGAREMEGTPKTMPKHEVGGEVIINLPHQQRTATDQGWEYLAKKCPGMVTYFHCTPEWNGGGGLTLAVSGAGEIWRPGQNVAPDQNIVTNMNVVPEIDGFP